MPLQIHQDGEADRAKQQARHQVERALDAAEQVLGADRVTGLRTERTELIGDGTVRGTGEFTDWPVQQVYHAVGYRSEPVEGVPFDLQRVDSREAAVQGIRERELYGAFALTEPAHGSDSVSLETSARRDGDSWIIDGHKRWIGNGAAGDVIVLYARDEAVIASKCGICGSPQIVEGLRLRGVRDGRRGGLLVIDR